MPDEYTTDSLMKASFINLSFLFLILSQGACRSDGLTAPMPQRPIEKVAIVGSGIAGLGLAHALENSPFLRGGSSTPLEVTIFEARRSLDYDVGAGVQINGGMSVLHRMNTQVFRAVADAALPLQTISSRCRPWFDSSSEYDSLLEISVPHAIREAGGSVTESLLVDDQPMAYTIMRGALQRTLMETLPASTRSRVQFGKSLNQIAGAECQGINLSFRDGTMEGPFDLVIGCDGINSAVKQYVDKSEISDKQAHQALYSGIRIRYAVQEEIEEHVDYGKLTQFFGDGAYALSGVYGNGAGKKPTKSVFYIYQDEDYIGPFKKASTEDSVKDGGDPVGIEDENADWRQDNRIDTGENTLKDILDHRIPDAELRPILDKSTRFFELGVYLHSPFGGKWRKRVPCSGRRYCVLSGDASHAMPPFLGQGANQAIQDAYSLASKIFEHNRRLEAGDGSVDLEALLEEYERVRWKSTTSISAKAFVLGYLESGSGLVSKLRDVVFRSLGSLGIAARVYLDAAVPRVE